MYVIFIENVGRYRFLGRAFACSEGGVIRPGSVAEATTGQRRTMIRALNLDSDEVQIREGSPPAHLNFSASTGVLNPLTHPEVWASTYRACQGNDEAMEAQGCLPGGHRLPNGQTVAQLAATLGLDVCLPERERSFVVDDDVHDVVVSTIRSLGFGDRVGRRRVA
jgi:hypothetical protein